MDIVQYVFQGGGNCWFRLSNRSLLYVFRALTNFCFIQLCCVRWCVSLNEQLHGREIWCLLMCGDKAGGLDSDDVIVTISVSICVGGVGVACLILSTDSELS